MPGDHRVTLTRRHAYRTNTNRVKTARAPGGRYIAKYISKARKGVVCGEAGCTKMLPGIKHMGAKGRNSFMTCKKREKTVSRCYGGSICGDCIRKRIVRSFLIEEVKIVKKANVEKKKKLTKA
jgi:large subunit ribosomal protein L34e